MRTVLQELAALAMLTQLGGDLIKTELVGDATRNGNEIRLTSARPWQTGAAWLAEKMQISTGFETTFDFRLTHQGGGGADGFAFVLQNTGPHAIAGRGSAGGFAMGDGRGDPHSPAIPSSIAVFFDTYKNAEDPSGNYVAICSTGRPENMQWPPARLAVATDLRVKLKDRKTHSVQIFYKPPLLSVFLDRSEVLIAPVDLSLVADKKGEAYVGFTASTGDGFQDHDILRWDFQPGAPKTDVSSNVSFADFACLPDRNLCTPDHAIVNDLGGGKYHIILPANGTASVDGQHAIVDNARGFVCSDSTHCGGPENAVVITTRDGKVDFSVRGANASSQGYFEFDASVGR